MYADSAYESDAATTYLSTSLPRHSQQNTDVISTTTADEMTSLIEQHLQKVTSDDVARTSLPRESSALPMTSSYAASEAYAPRGSSADIQLSAFSMEQTTNQDVTSQPLHTTTTTAGQIACRVNNNICYM